MSCLKQSQLWDLTRFLRSFFSPLSKNPSEDGDPTTYLGSLLQGKSVAVCPVLFQFMPISSCPSAECCWRAWLSLLLGPTEATCVPAPSTSPCRAHPRPCTGLCWTHVLMLPQSNEVKSQFPHRKRLSSWNGILKYIYFKSYWKYLRKKKKSAL